MTSTTQTASWTGWIKPETWTQDVTLPPRTDKRIDDLIADLWYAMDCPKSLPEAIADYIKRPYPWQIHFLATGEYKG